MVFTEYASKLSVSHELPLYSFMAMTELVTIVTRYPLPTPVGNVVVVNILSTGNFHPAFSSVAGPVAPVAPVSPLSPLAP